MKLFLWFCGLFLLLLQLSCSQNSKKNSTREPDPLEGASVNLEREFKFSERELDLDDKVGEGAYGPMPSQGRDDFDYATNQARLVPVTGLYLAPGLMRATLHVNLLKALEYHGVAVHLISGSGLGAVFATMYAFGLTPDLIEWRVFKFINAVEGEKPLSSRWINQLETILLDGLMNKRIESAGIALAIPVYNKKTGQNTLVTRGQVRTFILKQFEFSSSSSSGRYLSPLLARIDMGALMREQGADLNFAAQAVGDKLEFENANNFLAGIYGRLMGRANESVDGFDHVIFLPSADISLDGTKQVDEEMEKTLREVTDKTSQLSEIVRKWKSNKKQSEKLSSPSGLFDQDFLIREND